MTSDDTSRRLRQAALAIAVILGLAQVIAFPYRMSSEDAVSYLDVASAIQEGRWAIAVNGYWSPLYPLVLAVVKWFGGVGRLHEFPMLRGVNFGLYLLSLAAFDFLLRELMASHEAAVEARCDRRWLTLPRWMWFTGGYALFLWAALGLNGLRSDTPDMCTAALVHCAAAMLVSRERKPWSALTAALFGVVLGLAYLSKAAMFPIALVFLALAAAARDRSTAVTHASVALATFVIVAVPLIAALSMQKHRLTFGDSGRINYAWLVNPGDYVIPGLYWQGGPPGFGAPKHPPREIWDDPPAFEFNHLGETFPPWSDPSYWYDGLEPHFDLGAQLRAARTNLAFYLRTFGWPLLLFCGALALVGPGSFAALVTTHWRLLFLVACALGLYLAATNLDLANVPGQPSTRYIAAFLVLLFGAMISAIRARDSRWRRRILAAGALAAAIAVAINLLPPMAQDLRAMSGWYRERQLAGVVDALQTLGIGSGSKVAILGRKGDHEFWARMGGVQIVTQMPDGDAYRRLDPARRETLRMIFSRTGASAIVYRRVIAVRMAPEWRQLGDTQYWVSLLP